VADLTIIMSVTPAPYHIWGIARGNDLYILIMI